MSIQALGLIIILLIILNIFITQINYHKTNKKIENIDFLLRSMFSKGKNYGTNRKNKRK